jgi:hypothetical protein
MGRRSVTSIVQPRTPGDAIDAGRGSSFSSSLGSLVDDDADGFRRQ